MADNGCTYRNPLIRGGIDQPERFPEALNPDYVRVDERELDDLVRFVNHYAQLIQYYDLDNQPDGDWRPFFEKDMTSVIALLTDRDPDLYLRCLDKAESLLFDESSSYRDVRKALKTVFDLIATLAVELDGWYRKAVEGYSFHSHLDRVIKGDLREQLRESAAYYKGGFVGTDLMNKSYVADEAFCGLELTSFADLGDAALQDVWIVGEAESWRTFYQEVESDTSIYETDKGSGIKERSREGYGTLKSVATVFIGALKTVREKVPSFVEDSLESFSGHHPQMGLLLTFFKLFQKAQVDLNSLTLRHLNFYYEEVLRLARKDAVPDQVHLLVEIAKHVDSHKIEKGTAFKAGKDALGNQVIYRATEETVLNKASIDQLKTVFIDKEDQFRVYEKPVSNSKAGLGEELEKPSEGWRPFGESQLIETVDGSSRYLSEGEATMQFSSIGFAFSSPILRLSEGVRNITIDINAPDGSFPTSSTDKEFGGDHFKVLVTGIEGWIDASTFETDPTLKRANEKVRITIDLPEEFPPVSNYDAELHGLGFSTASPVLRILFTNNRRTESYLYGVLRDLVIDDVRIHVDVDGVKNLVIQNELGVQDPAKPFLPFGPSPSKGAAWYVGSREVFSKDLKTLTLNVEWHDYPKTRLQEYYNYDSDGKIVKNNNSGTPLSNSNFYADIRILRNGEFVKGEDGQALFPASLDNADDLVSESTEFSIGRDPELPEQSAYTVDSNRGFIRIDLQGPEIAFGHKFYPRLLMQELTKDDGTVPVEPYTPKVKSLTLNYTSEAVYSPASGTGMETDQFYHLLPFGTLKKIPATAEESGDIFLAPQFAEMADGKRIDFEGILYIGLKNLSPPQQLSLLFKMSEGSGDPGLDPPAVYWYYLANRQWQRFEPREIVSDATNELLETGLLKLDIPEGAGGETTILPGELTWIKAAITKNAPAVSSVIAVHAQALAAEFVDRNNDPTFLGTSLPPESIGTLKEKQAAVKKVNQPYASEGGKVAETDNGFHRRTSERLRHKERGITIWDYERLVLQHFPSIYKAKCINHSTYGLDTNGGTMDTEFAPGYVTVIVIPDLSDKTAFDPLKPRASLGKLKEIKCFLKKRLSVFAAENLDVSNPLFEQVQVEFNVEFREGRDEGYYQKQLVEDIAAFLSPWAFREGEDIVFGGAIHKSVILNFVEERPYVDFVTEFRMHHFIREKSQNSDVNEIIASESRSILVSHDTHIVNGNLIQGI